MKKLRFLLKILLRVAQGLAYLFIIFLLCSWLLKPASQQLDFDTKKQASEITVLSKIKDQTIDPDNMLRIQVDVDYSQGDKARWYPRHNPPVLQSMVDNGELPHVAERVGSEPLVLRGVNGAAEYGGTMYRLNGFAAPRLQPVQLVRFSPQGHPIVPNVAKSWTISKDGREYTFKLRKGMKWSDGHPFTSADILYWWEKEQCDEEVSPQGPLSYFLHHGKPMKVSAPDPQTVVFKFDDPNYLFFEEIASYPGYFITSSPRHYFLPYHPVYGDQKKIESVMREHNLINKRSVYSFIRSRVEKPTLAPWVMRTERMTSPETMVRNPYYWVVDENGKQLPYVDRLVSTDKSNDMLVISAVQGEVSVQSRYLRNTDYTMIMNQRKAYGYQVYHWLNGDGSDWGLAFNLNRRLRKGDTEVEHKAQLLKDKRFRQALSFAVNREKIIKAMLSGEGVPLSVGPSSLSPFYIPGIGDKYIRFDPEEANRILDACGLTERDGEGYRRFPGGPSLLFDINYCSYIGDGPGQFIIEDWQNVGIRARLRCQDRTIFYVEKSAGLHDMTIWGGYGSYFPILDMRYYLPLRGESNFALKNAAWYQSGGLFKDEKLVQGIPPPKDSPLYKAMVYFEKIKQMPTLEAQRKIFSKILEIAAENVYVLNIYSPQPQLCIVKNGIENVPVKGVYSWVFQSPANLGLETWCYKNPKVTPSEKSDILDELKHIRPIRPLIAAGMTVDNTKKEDEPSVSYGNVIGSIVRYGIYLALLLMVILVIMRFPFILSRLLMMIPTLFIISVVSFIVIELPPGDAINSKIMQMQEAGGDIDQEQINDIKTLFRTEEPAWKRYTWWMGIDWFFTFDSKDEGLLQGNMGRSMMDLKPVNEKVSDRLLFTFLISLGTILFTWAIALPIGIYSAVRQYSIFDYIFTVGGFIGMCIPGFLLAILLMYAAEAWMGLKVTGLFSPEYAAQSGWSTGKVLDLLRHIWLPIMVQGITGTAGMIRIMRANLLDELKKPYVITARAKGVRPMKLLFKYPVRMALTPFISGIGGIFPQLISGGAIVAIVMSLPTIGPMQLDAVMQQDMYLAGSMLMVLSMLSVTGTLFSDIMLLLIDPRIRMKGGAK